MPETILLRYGYALLFVGTAVKGDGTGLSATCLAWPLRSSTHWHEARLLPVAELFVPVFDDADR